MTVQCVSQVLLQPSRAELLQRLQQRAETGGHFMPASLLESQLATLEPEGRNIVAVQGTAPVPQEACESKTPAPVPQIVLHLITCRAGVCQKQAVLRHCSVF